MTTDWTTPLVARWRRWLASGEQMQVNGSTYPYLVAMTRDDLVALLALVDGHSPTHLTRARMARSIEHGDRRLLGGFVAALLDAYVKADPENRAALALGFEWLPELHAACAAGDRARGL